MPVTVEVEVPVTVEVVITATPLPPTPTPDPNIDQRYGETVRQSALLILLSVDNIRQAEQQRMNDLTLFNDVTWNQRVDEAVTGVANGTMRFEQANPPVDRAALHMALDEVFSNCLEAANTYDQALELSSSLQLETAVRLLDACILSFEQEAIPLLESAGLVIESSD